MPKRKASAWPASILGDPDVLSLDDEGRFVLCKICHVHYAVHGGKRPKPVVMNSNFRTRAWDVHKLRTNSHRLQREHERARRQQVQQAQQQHQLQQQQRQEQQEQQEQEEAKRAQQRADMSSGASSSATSSQVPTTTTSSLSGEGSGGAAFADGHCVHQARAHDRRATGEQSQEEEEMEQKRWHVEQEEDEEEEKKQEGGAFRSGRTSMAALLHRPAHRIRAASSPFPAVSLAIRPSLDPPTAHSGSTPPSPRDAAGRELEDNAAAAATVVAALRHPFQLPLAALPDRLPRHPETSATLTAKRDGEHEQGSPRITTAQMEGMARWRAMHDDVSRALRTEPAKRRKPSEQNGDTESGDGCDDSSDRSGSSVTASSSGGNATAGSGGSVDAPRLAETYSRRELRAANALAGTEEMSGNREMVARKLKSLNDQYRARNLRPEDTAAFLDPSSAAYKTFWGTFRDVYSSRTGSRNVAGTTTVEVSMGTAATNRSMHHHHHHHHYYPDRRREQHASRHEKTPRQEAANQSSHRTNQAAPTVTAAAAREADPTTPASSSNSSDDALVRQQQEEQQLPLPREQQHPHTWQVAHDLMLVSAFDRLTGAVSTQLSELFVHEAESRRSALAGLTTAVAELGTHQEHSIDKLINLQERQLDTMEEILQHKLWRESRLQRDEQEDADEQQEMKDEEMKEEGEGR